MNEEQIKRVFLIKERWRALKYNDVQADKDIRFLLTLIIGDPNYDTNILVPIRTSKWDTIKRKYRILMNKWKTMVSNRLKEMQDKGKE